VGTERIARERIGQVGARERIGQVGKKSVRLCDVAALKQRMAQWNTVSMLSLLLVLKRRSKNMRQRRSRLWWVEAAWRHYQFESLRDQTEQMLKFGWSALPVPYCLSEESHRYWSADSHRRSKCASTTR